MIRLIDGIERKKERGKVEDDTIFHDNQAGVLLGLWSQEDADLATKHHRSFGWRVRRHLEVCKMTEEERERYRQVRKGVL